jgi:hypothetical protein
LDQRVLRGTEVVVVALVAAAVVPARGRSGADAIEARPLHDDMVDGGGVAIVLLCVEAEGRALVLLARRKVSAKSVCAREEAVGRPREEGGMEWSGNKAENSLCAQNSPPPAPDL